MVSYINKGRKNPSGEKETSTKKDTMKSAEKKQGDLICSRFFSRREKRREKKTKPLGHLAAGVYQVICPKVLHERERKNEARDQDPM